MGELVRKSTVDQAVDHLRERILRGEILPGSPLRETPLAARLGVSRNTLRETLLRLEHESLVRHEAHRGAAVARPGPPDTDDIFFIRRMLESEGLRRMVDGLPESAVPLRNAVESLEARAKAGEWERYAEAEASFHGLLVAVLGSPRLTELHRRCLSELRLALIEVDRSLRAEAPRAYVGEHRRIVERIEAGRVEEGLELLARHLEDAASYVKGRPKNEGS